MRKLDTANIIEEIKPHRELGVITATCLVIGNMIGCGIYLLPLSLSRLGSISIFGWVAASGGAFLIGLIFARLSQLLPKQGGLFAYTLDGLGDYPAFIVAWHYWFVAWLGTSGMTVGLLAYLTIFFPDLASSPYTKFIIAMIVVWGLTFINYRGMKLAGMIQVVTVILKILPILFITIFGAFYFSPEYFKPFNLTGETDFSAIGTATSMAMWAFIGVESASIPARYVKNPKKNIPRATLWGVSISCLLYLVASFVLIGLVPNQEMQTSLAPYATVANTISPPSYASYMVGFVTFGAIVSILGGMNGWVLLQGQMPYSAACSGLFPKSFARLSKNETPLFALVVTGFLISALLFWHCFLDSENSFEIIIKLAGFSILVCYIFTIAASILLKKNHIKNYKIGAVDIFLTTAATTYIIWGIYNLDSLIKDIALPLFLLSTLVFVFIRYRK